MVGRQVTLLLLLLILAPMASAYSATPRLIWNGNEVRTIAPEAVLPNTVLKLTLTNDFSACSTERCTVSVTAPGVQQSFDVGRDCPGLNCTTERFSFSTPTTPYNITVAMQVGTRRIAPLKTQVQLTLDTTAPRVTGFSTGYCHDGECYVGNIESPFTVTFDDTVTSFNYKLVFLGADRRAEFKINSCQGRSCSGVIRGLACRQDEEFNVNLVEIGGIGSREDAQNPVEGTLNQKVICRTDAPQILEWKPPRSEGALPVPYSSGTLAVEAKVKVFAGQPNATVNSTKLNNVPFTSATCSQEADEGVFTCRWQIRNLIAGTGDYEFKVADAVGNYILASPENRAVRITILNRTNQSAPQFFTGNVKQVTPDEINRMVIELARANRMPYPLYVTYELQRANRPNARIVNQQIRQCWTKLPNETNYTSRTAFFSMPESRVLYQNQDWDKPNRLDLEIRATREEMKRSDIFNARCQIDLVIAEGDSIYATPQSLNLSFDVKLRESALGQPGQEMVEKIQREEEKLNGGQAKTIRQLEKLRQQGAKICDVVDMYAQYKSVMADVGAVSNGLCATGVFAAIGGTLKGVVGPATCAADDAHGVIVKNQLPIRGPVGQAWDWTKLLSQVAAPQYRYVTSSDSFIEQLCYQVNCRMLGDIDGGNFNTNSGSWAQDFTATLGNEMLDGANVVDPESGIVGSALAVCAGGVVYNAQKYQAIDCGYLQCLKEQAENGHSVHVCGLGKSYRMCTQFYGEIGELPYVRFFKNVMSNINHVIQNSPSIVLRFSTRRMCPEYEGLPGATTCANCYDWKQVACSLRGAIFDMIDSQKLTTQAAQGIRSGEAAEKALQLCSAVAENKPPNKYVQKGEQKAMAYLQAQIKDEQNRKASTGVPGTEDYVSDVDAAWDAYRAKQNPAAPQSLSSYSHVDILTDGTTYTVYVSHSKADPEPGTSRLETVTRIENLDEQQANALKQKLQSSDDLAVERVAAQGYRFTPTFVDSNGKPAMGRYDENGNLVPPEGGAVAKTAVQQAREYERSRQVFTSIQGTTVQVGGRDGRSVKTTEAVGQLQRSLDADGKCTSDRCTKLRGELAQAGIRYDEATGTYTTTVKQGDQTVTVQITQQDVNIQILRERAATQRLVDRGTQFAAKWLYDQGYLNYLMLSSWSDTLPVFGDVSRFSDNYLNPEKFKQNLCNDFQYDISDNDEGAVYQQGTVSVPQVIATFGSEVRELTNESGTIYSYANLVHVENPQRPRTNANKNTKYDFQMSVVLTDLQSCIEGQECPEILSLTNGANFNLSEGSTFGNGAGPKVRIIHTSGVYNKICIRFDKKFPDPQHAASRTSYCRTITDKTFERGSPVPPPTTGKPATGASSTGATGGTGGTTGPAGPDPMEGWR